MEWTDGQGQPRRGKITHFDLLVCRRSASVVPFNICQNKYCADGGRWNTSRDVCTWDVCCCLNHLQPLSSHAWTLVGGRRRMDIGRRAVSMFCCCMCIYLFLFFLPRSIQVEAWWHGCKNRFDDKNVAHTTPLSALLYPCPPRACITRNCS